MTRTTRRSVEKDRAKAEEMPPPPPPPPAEPVATSTTVPEETSEAPITVHKRIRSPLFEKVFEKALKTSLSGVTPEAWNKCFPTPTARRPESMKDVRQKFCEIYELNVRKNFQDIIASRKLLASLDNLDILVSEAQSRKARFLEEHPQPPLPMDPPPKPQSTDKEAEAGTAQPAPTDEGMKDAGGQEANKEPVVLPPPPIFEYTPEDLYMSHLYPILQVQSERLESLKRAQQDSIDKLIVRRQEQQEEMKQLIALLEKRLKVVDEAATGVKEILEMDKDEEMAEVEV